MNMIGKINELAVANTNVGPRIDLGFSGIATNIMTMMVKHTVAARIDLRFMMLVLVCE